MTNENIPFLDLVAPHVELEAELTAVFQKVLRTASFIGGPMVEEFERGFAEFCKVQHCVGLGSGTDAVRFALMAAGVVPGDIVLTVPHTFIATAEGISQAGARPEFIDIDERTYCLDPKKLADYCEQECFVEAASGKLLHRKSKAPVTAIVPVHLYGQTADMDAIQDIAQRYRLLVIEDACQAHGAEYFSKKQNRWCTAGSMGVAAAFSFYPGKNLGACGEAGAVTTNDEHIARITRMLRDHGQAKKYYHDIEGYNGRLDSLQAGMLSVKLRHLADWNRSRQNAAREYDKLFSSMPGVIAPLQAGGCKSVYHLYVIRTENRDELQKYLAEANIHTGIHYPVPLHRQKAYADRGYKDGDFPVTEKVAAEILSLPMYPQLSAEQQRRVAERVAEFTALRAAAAAAR